jgi:sugar O-acyltransferase (sialic acid O-acetyltransferase NeuD family)
MNTNPLFVFGAGGHGRVVADAAVRAGVKSIVFVDKEIKEAEVQGWSVVKSSDISDAVWRGRRFIVAIGSNEIRARIFRKLRILGATASSVTDPSSIVSPHATIGDGTFLAPGVIVNTGARIGENCILNTGASIDHDCILESNVQVSPQACLAGNVRLGESVMVGMGAMITPGRRVGRDAVIGAGAVVTRDLPGGVVAWGCPAKIVRMNDQVIDAARSEME